MDAADRAAEALSARLDDAGFFWQPDGGRRWSVALCLDHLAVSNEIYGKAVREGVAKAQARGWARRGPSRPGFFGRKFIASLEPPVRLRTSAPGKIKPMPSRTRAEIMRAYRAAHDAVRETISAAAAVDINRATFANPFLPMVAMKVSTGLNVLTAHDRRHLWQAEQVERELRARTG